MDIGGPRSRHIISGCNNDNVCCGPALFLLYHSEDVIFAEWYSVSVMSTTIVYYNMKLYDGSPQSVSSRKDIKTPQSKTKQSKVDTKQAWNIKNYRYVSNVSVINCTPLLTVLI